MESQLLSVSGHCLGLYYMTRDKVNVKGDGRVFSNPDEVLRAYESETLDIHANIKVRITNADKGTFLERYHCR